MNKYIGVGLVVVGVFIGLLFGAVQHKEPTPPQGYNIKITHSTGTYYANDWRFDETHKCVVFVDQDQKHRVLCGDYNMVNVK